jgi:hypothetical protein
MRSAAPGLVQRTTWPLTVGQNRLYESKNTKVRQARMDEKCAPSSHTPSLLLLRLLQWMDATVRSILLCSALLSSTRFYNVTHVISFLGFLGSGFQDMDRQTPPLLLLYIGFHSGSVSKKGLVEFTTTICTCLYIAFVHDDINVYVTYLCNCTHPSKCEPKTSWKCTNVLSIKLL